MIFTQNRRLTILLIPSVIAISLTLSGCASHSSEMTTAQPQIIETPQEKKARELNDEKMRQQFEAQWEKDQKKKAEEQEAKLKVEKTEREAEKVVQKAFDEENKEADADVEKLVELDSLSKMDCELNEAYISPEGWASLGVYKKENFTRVLMAYCSRHGGDGNIITIRNEMDGKELGSIGPFGFKVK